MSGCCIEGLLNYIAKNTGWPATIGSAADLSDNIIEMDLYKSPYPSWLSKPTLRGYNNVTIKKAVQAFGEKHQIRCAHYAPCRNIMGGVWLKQLLVSINSAISGESPSVIGYVSHTEVTLSVMKLMGVEKDELTTSAGFVIEFRDKPEPSIRILNHDPNPIDEHIIYRATYTPDLAKISDKTGWIPFKKFEALVEKFAIANWQKACGQQLCATTATSVPSSTGEKLMIDMGSYGS
ncbi:hypothetical protein GCK32_010410 [Trichostrongylus colubriformis]|uniref:Uncharacterized protein n=1 Tax=Trichostrongylus colubriformis TaxID=6319 RepID=A0AAN8EX92_TRICO